MLDIEPFVTREIVVGVLYGAAMGGLYFGSLWLTLRRLVQQRRPATILLASFAARFGVLMFGFYVLAEGGRWEQLVAALLGFIAMRVLLIRCSIFVMRPSVA